MRLFLTTMSFCFLAGLAVTAAEAVHASDTGEEKYADYRECLTIGKSSTDCVDTLPELSAYRDYVKSINETSAASTTGPDKSLYELDWVWGGLGLPGPFANLRDRADN